MGHRMGLNHDEYASYCYCSKPPCIMTNLTTQFFQTPLFSKCSVDRWVPRYILDCNYEQFPFQPCLLHSLQHFNNTTSFFSCQSKHFVHPSLLYLLRIMISKTVICFLCPDSTLIRINTINQSINESSSSYTYLDRGVKFSLFPGFSFSWRTSNHFGTF